MPLRSSNLSSLSNSSSIAGSRARTPLPDSEENGALDFNFQSIDELLKSKLESLQSFINAQESASSEPQGTNVSSTDHKQKSADQMNKMRIQSGSTGINDIIHSLTMPRTEVSSNSRELLLAQLYNLIISKALCVYNESNIGTDKYVTEDNTMELTKIFISGNYRSPSEFLLLYRSIIALISSDIDEFSGLVTTEFCSYIEKIINDPATSIITNENKSNLISGYAALLLILHNGSSSFGIEDKITWLIEASEGFCSSAVSLSSQIDSGNREYSTVFDENDDKKIVNDALNKVKSEADVSIACLHAVGCLLTLVRRGEYLNDFLMELMPKIVEILDNDVNTEISKAAGRVIGLCYELYTYEENEEEEDDNFNYNAPYYEQESLLSSIERLANISTKKLSKKDKKEVHSIFRDIFNTITNYTNKEKRIEIYKKSPEGMELINSAMDSIYIKLSKSRSLPINSWFLYLRLIHLKWCFSYGVHNQLVSSNEIKDILKEPPTEYQLKYGHENTYDNLDDDVHSRFSNKSRFVTDDKKKSEQIRKARIMKLTNEIDDLEINT